MSGTNAGEVVAVLHHHGRSYARDLPIRATVQSISNALRHAERYGWVVRTNDKDGIAVWAVEPALASALKATVRLSQ